MKLHTCDVNGVDICDLYLQISLSFHSIPTRPLYKYNSQTTFEKIIAVPLIQSAFICLCCASLDSSKNPLGNVQSSLHSGCAVSIAPDQTGWGRPCPTPLANVFRPRSSSRGLAVRLAQISSSFGSIMLSARGWALSGECRHHSFVFRSLLRACHRIWKFAVFRLLIPERTSLHLDI